MGVRVKKLGPEGHREFNLTLDEAKQAAEADVGKYFIIDEETTEILKPIRIREGQKLMFVPIVQGG